MVLMMVAMMASLSSCRSLVLEDRSECPCFLFFNITNASEFNGAEKVYTCVYDVLKEKQAARDTLLVKQMTPEGYYFKLRSNQEYEGFGIAGLHRCQVDRSQQFTVPVGEDYDPIYRFGFETEGFEESKVVPVEFTKEHVKLTIIFSNFDDYTGAEGQFPFQIALRSNTCGINGLTGLPVRGEYRFVPDEMMAGEFEMHLPRQADNSLMLEIWVKEGIKYFDEGLVDEFSLYELLNESGSIDWKEKNLPDVELIIDYVEHSYRIKVSPWEQSIDLSYNL